METISLAAERRARVTDGLLAVADNAPQRAVAGSVGGRDLVPSTSGTGRRRQPHHVTGPPSWEGGGV